MNKPKSTADITRLRSISEEQNHMLDTLKEKLKNVQDPSELDAATQHADMPARLLNFHLATLVDLPWQESEKAVFIPVQITDREGGRKSIFFLDEGEETLVGIYITSEGGIALRYMKRATGSTKPAQEGDVYSIRITNRDDELVFEGQEKLLSLDLQTGQGNFAPLPDAKLASVGTQSGKGARTCTACYAWSSIRFDQPWC